MSRVSECSAVQSSAPLTATEEAAVGETAVPCAASALRPGPNLPHQLVAASDLAACGWRRLAVWQVHNVVHQPLRMPSRSDAVAAEAAAAADH